MKSLILTTSLVLVVMSNLIAQGNSPALASFSNSNQTQSQFGWMQPMPFQAFDMTGDAHVLLEYRGKEGITFLGTGDETSRQQIKSLNRVKREFSSEEVADISFSASSQSCGTTEPTTDPIPAKMHPAYQMFSQSFVNNMNSGSRNSLTMDTIPYKVHVIRASSGTGGISTASLTTAFNNVNTIYTIANMHFKQCGTINYIDSDTYYNFNSANEAALTSANNVTNVINIYFTNSVTTSSGSAACGYAYFPGGPDVIMMDNSCAVNGSTLPHEIGHYFNLYHTHSSSNGAELVNGTNCSSAGDLLCDTPADPQLSSSTVSSACAYTGTATDANGMAYTPDPTNIMSYSRKACRTFFSPQQYARISFSALNQRAYLVCSAGGGGGTGLINGCAVTTQYPSETFTPTTSWQTAASNIYAGEYSVYNVVAGDTYEWSLCTADGGNVTYDSELTLTDGSNNELDYNNDFCSTQSKITWTATITGTVRVHVTENHCLTNSTNTALVYKKQTGCTSLSQYPSGTLTPITSWQTASAVIYAGEYSVYNVVSGETYEWSTCTVDGGNATYDTELTLRDASGTFLDYNNDFCGTLSKITWTSTITGTVRVHITEVSCQTNSSNTTLVYKKQVTAGTPNLTKQADNISASGNNITVSTTIENDGTASSGAFDVRFYASTNTIISITDVPIYTATISSLAANATSVISQTIDLCTIAALSDGSSYYIGYIIDYTNVVAESDETDNIFAWTTLSYTLNCATGCLGTSQYPATIFTPTTTWQTAATNIYAGEYSVHNVVSGETYEWSLCIADGGNASYDSELTLTNGSNTFIDYNDDFCSTQSKITWTATFTGVVRVHVTEHNCQTNTTNTTLVYKKQGVGSPNLTKQADNISASGNNVAVGTTIENNGGTASGAFDVRFYASTNTIISTADVPIYTATISSLAANATSIISQNIDLCTITSLNDGSSYYIGYIIDYTNVVAESDETDNTFAWTATNYTLNCVTTSTISLSANPTAGGTVGGGGTFNNGQSVAVTAAANTGWNFDGWKENGTMVSTNANYTFAISADKTLTAEFLQQQYTISASANPTTGGSTAGTGTFTYNQSATLTAAANTGWNFDGWKENGMTVSTNANYTFNVTTNRILTAEFSQQQYTISASANPTAGGSTSGSGTFTYNQSATLTATASTGWNFDGWKENGMTVSTNVNYTFNVTADRTVTAEFSQQQFTINVTADSLQGGIITGGGTYNYGQQVTVTATPTPSSPWIFGGWYENGADVSNLAIYTFTAFANRDLMANFDFNVSTKVISKAEVNVTLSPNPTANILRIQIEHPTLKFDKIQIYNMIGQLTQVNSMNGQKSKTISVNSFPVGTYIIQMYSEDETQVIVEKIIVVE
jgi:hypothetical protein